MSESRTSLANRGIVDLTQVAGLLAENRRSIDSAVREILVAMDKVEILLGDASCSGELSEESPKTLCGVREQLFVILSALQFQDIASQQVEAINASLANLGKILVNLADSSEGLLPLQIEVQEGTFDSQASFDREKARQNQKEIDRLMNNTADKPKQEKRFL